MQRQPESKVPQPREADIQRAIRLALGRCPDVGLWRNNVGSFRDQQGRYVTFGLCPGSSDLVGILRPSGRWLALEVKRPGQKPRPEQEGFLQFIRSMGGFACVVTSPEEALAAVERARKGERE
jgi:hypothetical protein